MSTTSSNLGLTLAETTDVVNVDTHIAANFSTLDSKWSTPGTPAAVEVGSSGTPGSSTVISRSDHVHGITTGTPVSTSTSNSAGSNTTVAASDHIHKTGDNSVATATIQDSAVTEAKIDILDTPANDEVLTYDSGTGRMEWQSVAQITTTTPLTSASLATDSVKSAQIEALAVGSAEIAAEAVTEAKLDALDTPANDEVLTYDSATGRLEWQAATALVSTTIADNSITVAKLEAVAKPLVGKVDMYAGSSMATPKAQGWLLCDGTAVSRTTFSALFAVISTTFGSGDGSTTFNLPDFQSRFPIGKSGTYALGATGGATTANANHSHNLAAAGVGGSLGDGSSGFNDADAPDGGSSLRVPDDTHTHDISGLDVTGTTDASTTLTSLSILNPYLSVNFIIYAGVAS